MALEFTPDGMSIQTYGEIVAEIVAEYRAIYGTDINTDPNSPDGQRIGIEAKGRLDLQTAILNLYNQFDPDLASGTMLDIIIKVAGLSRRPASRSQVDATVTTDRALTLSAGYAVDDDLGQTWITLADQSLVLGANTVTLVSEVFGAIEADAATITSPATVVIGVVSVTNALAATVGRNEETDAELRIRRNQSLATPATSTTGGLFAALGDLAGVTSLVVYENDTDAVDAMGIPAHSLWCVLLGGTTADIVETIAKNKTGGTGLKGTVTGTYVETLIRPDGEEYFITHDMAFDRPTEVPLYVTLTVEGAPGATVDQTAIKNALAAHVFTIGEDAIASALYRDVYESGAGFTATVLEISRDDVTYTDGAIVAAADELFTISTANITITDITP